MSIPTATQIAANPQEAREYIQNLVAENAELLDAAKQGEELRLWICEAVSKAIYEQEESGNLGAWKALAEAMYDGTLASYSDAFAPVIAKAGGEKQATAPTRQGARSTQRKRVPQ
jgi:hypothetical protein